ncbi:MAG TPA: hypothetical protein VFB80_11665, partial [Pirellulaceae bacterium]|nr:hypothetical protein [Pirellulaceae bacterium]
MDPAQPNTPAETTPATPPAAPPNAGAPPAAPATPPNPRLAKLAALGFENVKDEGEALDRLYDAHVQMKDQFGQQLQQTLEQVRAQVQPPAAPEAGQRPKFFDPPKVDLAVVAQYREADGNWKENTPAEVKNAALAYQGYVEAFGRKLLTDPEATLAPLIERIAARVAEERYGQATAQQQEAQFFERAYAENEWLFEKSPHTGRVDRQRLSAEGQRFNDL